MQITKNLITATLAIALGLAVPGASAEAAEAGRERARALSAEWWQWALSLPPAVNPIGDATGEFCAVGQRGSTWLLAGAFEPGTVRACTIPANRELFIPVFNGIFFNSPNACGQGPESITAAEMRAALAADVEGATGVRVDLDGERVRGLRRLRSRVFELALPPDNVFGPECPGGVYPRTVADGIYLTLPPLAPGEHTLRIRAEQPEYGVVIDVTYHLTVVPVRG